MYLCLLLGGKSLIVSQHTCLTRYPQVLPGNGPLVSSSMLLLSEPVGSGFLALHSAPL